jgi:hypothetical protein
MDKDAFSAAVVTADNFTRAETDTGREPPDQRTFRTSAR